MYCLICIVSQYQEYKIGRGLTANHYIIVSLPIYCFNEFESFTRPLIFIGIIAKWFSSPFSPIEQSNGVPHYKAPEKSCIILHQSKTVPMNNGHTNFSLIQETQKNGSASKCYIISVDWSFWLPRSSDFPQTFCLFLRLEENFMHELTRFCVVFTPHPPVLATIAAKIMQIAAFGIHFH